MSGRSPIFLVLDCWVLDRWLAVAAQATASQSVHHTQNRRSVAKSQTAGGQPDGIVLSLLLLDEPLSKLDSLTRITMQGELVALWQRAGFTALLVTHDVEEALFMANRVIVFSDRPARIKAEIVNDLPYPRHRGDPQLAELRHQVLGLLGLDATW
jgi:ABC-type taurine transport system ATPase subunit